MIEIPGYKIHREIDRSDYCQSYSAIQLSTGKTMLVSIFAHSDQQYQALKSVFNDIENKLAQRTFGVITPIKEFIKTKNYTYLISDLLSKSCAQIYKERLIDIHLILENIYKIALSLDLYHQINFYHGGITLDNIYHDSDDALTLGLAAFNDNFIKSQSDQRSDLNRECYKAPEKEVSESKSRDFYALGVVLYELIFKQKPFVAKTQQQLDQLKQACVIVIPNKQYEQLKPLFAALLNPHPEQRIASSTAFFQMCSDCQIQLKSKPFDVIDLSSKESFSSIPNNLPPKTFRIPTYSYYLAALAIVSIFTYILIQPSEKQDLIYTETLEESLIETINDDNPNTKKINPELVQFIKTAQQAIDSQQYTTALLATNQALKTEPQNEDALTLKRKIENELKIKSFIKQAEQLVRNGNIITPKDNNALNTYKKVQALLPSGDTRAIDGLRNISKTYFRLASKQIDLNNMALAQSIISEGLTAIPSDVALKQLKTNIENKKLAEQQALEKQRLAQEQQRIKQLEKEKQDQNARLAQIELNKQRALNDALEKQRLKEFQIQREQQRNQQINNLITEANNALKDNQLTLANINIANDNLQSLEFLSVSEDKSTQLRNKIKNAYVLLAQYQVSVQQFKAANDTITNGLVNDPNNTDLITILDKMKVTTAKIEAEKQTTEQTNEEEKALPIFGTF